MKDFFAGHLGGHEFHIFSTQHYYGLFSVFFLTFLMVVLLKQIRSQKLNEFTRYFLATALLVQEASLSIWRVYHGRWQVSTSLPLHLCGMGILLSALMLYKKDRKLYDFLYFWGTAGAFQAMLQPNLSEFGFPHYRFFQFFISHGLLFGAIIFATFIMNFRPRFKSIYRAFVITNIFAFFVGILNFILGSNYMFLAHKPETSSVLDFFGPWPLYIIPLEFVAIFMFSLVYLPFLIADLVTRSYLVESKID